MMSFSTCWSSHRHTDGEVLLGEIQNLGFSRVELGQGCKICLIPGIKRLLKRGRVRITSLHNLCPAPIEFLTEPGTGLEFTASRPSDRATTLRWTRQTIDYASELGAPFVIIHLGDTGLRGVTSSLMRRLDRGEIHSRDFVREKLAAVQRRRKVEKHSLEAARHTLRELSAYGRTCGVRIAVESRGDYEMVPNENEMLELMQEFAADDHVGYWHDFGAVQRKANLGFLNHAQWLEAMRPYLFGSHLHDLHWPGDNHQVPLSGMIDFKTLLPLLPEDAPLVWEIDATCRKADIVQAIAGWEREFKPARHRPLSSR